MTICNFTILKYWNCNWSYLKLIFTTPPPPLPHDIFHCNLEFSCDTLFSLFALYCNIRQKEFISSGKQRALENFQKFLEFFRVYRATRKNTHSKKKKNIWNNKLIISKSPLPSHILSKRMLTLRFHRVYLSTISTLQALAYVSCLSTTTYT